jgi:hypothetical protein
MDQSRPPIRSHWRRFFDASLAALLLLPVPAWAALTFGPWLLQSQSPLVVGASADLTGETITFTPFVAQTTATTFTVFGNGTAIWDGTGNSHINAAFNNWNTIGGTGNITFQVTYNGNNLFPGALQPLPVTSNQFSGTQQSLVNGSAPVGFSVTFTNATWSAPSSVVTLVFSNP